MRKHRQKANERRRASLPAQRRANRPCRSRPVTSFKKGRSCSRDGATAATDQPLNNESRKKSPAAAAASPRPALPNIEDAGARAPEATGSVATQTAAKANPVQLVDPNEVNDLDRTADASLMANSSWTTYLLLLLGAALAVAFAMCFFSR